MSPNDFTHWRPTAPDQAQGLADVRRQLHLAVQLGAAFGISYLSHEPDDGHITLGWDGEIDALLSHPAAGARGPVTVGVRVHDLTLIVTRDSALVQEVPLIGLTLAEATDRLRNALSDEGLDAAQLSLARHYEIPYHPIADGAPFSVGNGLAFAELSRWFANAAAAGRAAHRCARGRRPLAHPRVDRRGVAGLARAG